MRHIQRFSLLLLLCLFATLPAFAEDEASGDDDADRYELVYEGEFLDQDKRPVSGVFPLEFKLYKSEKSRKAVWSEKHFVAVSDGRYEIALGERETIPASIANSTVFLGIELNGKEIVRQPLEAKVVSEEMRLGGLVASGGTCGFCESSANAETLGGQPPEAFASANVKTLLDKHIKDPRAHGGGGGGGGGTLGSQTWTSERAGGGGGSQFNLECPSGYVVTGVTGRAGAVIDSFQVVCTKLE